MVSVRDLDKKESYEHLKKFDPTGIDGDRLIFKKGELTDKDCWEEILSVNGGVSAVIHCASPNPF